MAGYSTKRRRGPLKKTASHVGPNMTPMVDVVMCILIFFMLGSTFIVQEQMLKSNAAVLDKGGLGTDVGSQKLPNAKLWIELTRQGDDTWVKAGESAPMLMNRIGASDQKNNDAILGNLLSRKKLMSDDVQVLILPHERVPYQDVITIYSFCVKAAFKQVAFCPAKPG